MNKFPYLIIDSKKGNREVCSFSSTSGFSTGEAQPCDPPKIQIPLFSPLAKGDEGGFMRMIFKSSVSLYAHTSDSYSADMRRIPFFSAIGRISFWLRPRLSRITQTSLYDKRIFWIKP